MRHFTEDNLDGVVCGLGFVDRKTRCAMTRAEDRVMNAIENPVREGKRGPVEPGGLAGWVLGVIRGRAAKAASRHMQVVETLALGGRRQLMLVTCDGERFLVGSGADRVETIVKVGQASEETWA